METETSTRRSRVLVVACVLALTVWCAAAAAMPNRHQVSALYVIDHNGTNPASEASLLPYSQAMERILARCRVTVDDLTNRVLALAEQASVVGGRDVSSLQMLRAIARRLSWGPSRQYGCGYVFNLAEAHMETGGP